MSLNNLAHNLAGSQRPWADCCHGNLTASISLAHTFPLNSRPMTDQPTGKSGSPEAPCAQLARLRTCMRVLMRSRYASSGPYNLAAPHKTHRSRVLPVGGRPPCIEHGTLAKVKFISGKTPRRAKALSDTIQTEESSGRRYRKGEERRDWYSRKRHRSQSVPGWQGSRESPPRSSAGSNMCSHYNLHCNQNLTGD